MESSQINPLVGENVSHHRAGKKEYRFESLTNEDM